MMKILLVLLVPLSVAGCASSEPVRGWAPEANASQVSHEVGQRFADFKFVDSKATERSLRWQLGDYTILAFTRCESDTHGPAAKLLQDIVRADSTLDNVRVVGIDIHWTASGCKEHDNCHLVDVAPNLGTICDATGSIHRLYGALQEDWLYVIGPDRTIELSAPMTKGSELSRQLKVRVEQLSRERVLAPLGFHRKV